MYSHSYNSLHSSSNEKYFGQTLKRKSKHILSSINPPPPENLAVYDIVCRDIVEPCMPPMTLWRMRIAYWVTKATNTHPEYLILLLFHCNERYAKAPESYFLRIFPVLLLRFCSLFLRIIYIFILYIFIYLIYI